MFRNLIKTICRLARLGTWNLIDVVSKVCIEQCLLFDELTCVRIEQNHLSAAPSACDFQIFYLRSIHCWNKCHGNLFHFKQFDIMFILTSSTNVGIYSNILSQIWQSLPNTAIQSSILLMQTRWPTHTSTLLTVIFYSGSQLPIFWKWNRITILGNFVTGEQDLEKKFFWQWELKQLLSILW